MGALRVIFVAGLPVVRIAQQDAVGLRAHLASLESANVVSQALVARSGLVAEATFHRDCKAFGQGGIGAVLERGVRGSKGPRKVTVELMAEIEAQRKAGLTFVAIGAVVGLSEASVRLALKDNDPLRQQSQPMLAGEAVDARAEKAEPPEQDAIPSDAGAGGVASQTQQKAEEQDPGHKAPQDIKGEEGVDEMAAVEAAINAARAQQSSSELALRVASQRGTEMVLARLGLIEEQSALFPPMERTKYAGALLAVALMSVTGLLQEVRKHLGGLRNGLYGVRSVVTTLLVMALLRCKRPEQLKGFDPTELGAVLGLCRAPEMKTLRRKFNALAGDEIKVVDLVRAMAKRHADRVKGAIAFLYIDGHVRPYFGDMPFRKVALVLEMLAGLKVSPGALVRMGERAAVRCEPTREALIQQLRQADVVHGDETDWHIIFAEAKAWLWVFTAPEPRIILYQIRLSRGIEVPLELLGDEFIGTLGVDGWAGYLNLPYDKGQCIAHLLRRCRSLLEVNKQGAARFPLQVQQVLGEAVQVKALQGTADPGDYAALVEQVQGRMAGLLEGRVEQPLNRKFQKHLLNHQDELFTFLDVPLLTPSTTWPNARSGRR